jgi:hypothetical protein
MIIETPKKIVIEGSKSVVSASSQWHKQGSATDIGLLTYHYEIPFIKQNNYFIHD